MKRKLLPLFAAFTFLACLFLAGTAFDKSESVGVSDDFSTKTWNDTITNTESNTLTLPFQLVSDYQVGVHVVLSNISGTRSIKIVMDEAASATGSDWYPIDSVATQTGTSTLPIRIEEDHTYGRRHRIRINGTTGTMVVKYTVIYDAKKKK